MMNQQRLLPFLLFLTGLLLLSSCASRGTYKVKPGDSLSTIAIRYNMSVNEIAKINGISNPNLIRPGQILKVKGPTVRNKKVASSRSSTIRGGSQTTSVGDTNISTASTAIKAPATPQDRISTGITGWQKPTQGNVIKGYNPNIPGQKGIRIAGSANQPIVAAHDGEVVFAGTGNAGYGQLVIIKHNSTTYSAYGYLASMIAKEGDRVRQGEQIATMGHNSEGKNILYFEIRTQGQTVNPLNYI